MSCGPPLWGKARLSLVLSCFYPCHTRCLYLSAFAFPKFITFGGVRSVGRSSRWSWNCWSRERARRWVRQACYCDLLAFSFTVFCRRRVKPRWYGHCQCQGGDGPAEDRVRCRSCAPREQEFECVESRTIASLTPLFSWLKGVPPGIYPSSRQKKKNMLKAGTVEAEVGLIVDAGSPAEQPVSNVWMYFVA